MNSQIQKLIRKSRNPKLIEEALEFAQQSYKEEKWISGEYYFEHAKRLALILHAMGVDEKTIVAGLLYNVANISNMQEQKIKLQAIENKFGKEIAMLAERASELNKIYYSIAIDVKEKKVSKEEKIENVRRMFFAISKDLRVILIKLAARIDGMNNIRNLPKQMQQLYATETLQIFMPIANRLGLGEIKTNLEDLSFATLLPEKFKWLQENIKEKYEERQKYLKKFIPHLKKILKQERINFLDINSRAKSYWSTYKKLTKRNMDFEKIHDLVALKIIVADVATCYKTLGIIHKYYKPISEEINDYIARPKLNGYKSLHTTVLLEKNNAKSPILKTDTWPSIQNENPSTLVSEIQIRTDQMDKEAEYGVCAHWSYKEQINLQKEGEKFNWTKEIPEFWKTFKIDFFYNQVFTFTPRGDIIVLPKESTPIDFAYSIHSDIGNHCEGAKIGGKIIPLSQVLKNGDVVEIIINKKRKPSQDWLKFVKTNFAKSHIKKLILNIPVSIFSVPSFVKKKISEIDFFSKKTKRRKEEISRLQNNRRSSIEEGQVKKEKPQQIYLAGQKGMLVNMAKCCSPKPKDHVRAYITKYRATVLHKISCRNIEKLSQKFPEKIIEASWE